VAAVLLAIGVVHPQSAAGQSATPQGLAPLQLPAVTVTAQKEPSDAQRLPVSVTAVTSEMLARAGVREVSEAALYAPNTYFSELSARRVSNARFRGIGSSPANPGITTVIDGVPQLNTSSSSVELIDIDQVEFVRGPQSALFGRNALGGVINITSRLPSLDRWTGHAAVPLMNANGRGFEASVSGPLAGSHLGFSAAIGAGRRDGFTENVVTGSSVDDRSAFFGKAQLLWAPASTWHARLIVTAERDRDGDYALGDLAALRDSPFDVARDVEGRTDRDVLGVTALSRREGPRFTISTVTGIVRWEARDLTDLDYSPIPLVTRDNQEQALQFSQEVRVASSASAPVTIGTAALGWQAGVFFFAQNYEQDAVNDFSPFLLSPQLGFPVRQHSPQSALADVGFGAFGHATLALTDRLDLSAGLRFDQESKEATLHTFFLPEVAPANLVEADRSFSSLSPQVSVAYALEPDRLVYASAGQGFKAGGFNPASPAGRESYGEEHAWHLEGGIKTRWGARRATVNAAAFYIDWEDLQLNLPDPLVPAQFYIANVGGATAAGVELELAVRAHRHLDLFGAVGYTASKFKAGSVSLGTDVSGNVLPGTPDYTATMGAETSAPVGADLAFFGRAEAVFYGAFKYDDTNAVGQDAYSLTNVRAGLRSQRLSIEGWVRNAFDTRYIPVAFAYGNFAPSGFVGEPGRPRTFGVSVGVGF
jgi:iron complex outermembrane receptor protein